MSQASAIEWTDTTWNPVTGCDRISAECDHCYALDLAARLKGMGQARYQNDGDPRTSGPGFGLTLHPDKLEEPSRWRKPRMVFVNSMSDLFHKYVPEEFIQATFGIMEIARQHTFQVLTKRPKRMRHVLSGWAERGWQPPENVWLGTSIGLAQYAWRADHLRETPAAIRFISAEPLLGPLAPERMFCSTCSMEGPDDRCDECEGIGDWRLDGGLRLDEIDWLIVGGESGPQHRPIKADWVRDLRDLAADYETAFFFKQWGGRTPKAGGRELDGRTWSDYPTRRAM